jgi:hypothetical protein
MKSQQLTLPIFGDAVPNAVVEVVEDPHEHRARVRPRGLTGWVKFPRALRQLGARYEVDELRPLRGGAWGTAGQIRRLG